MSANGEGEGDPLPAHALSTLLERIADALERLAPAPAPVLELSGADAFVWHAETGRLSPVARVNQIDLDLLQGIERQSETLLNNTRRFARGYPANNALLWGARGTGKSSLVKAIHHRVNRESPGALVLIEVHREDLATLPHLLERLAASPRRCVLFCDDLSFDGRNASYKSLKSVLEGGVEGRPDNVLFYATSNRRHLMPREMIENERSTAVNPAEAVEEKVSLSDRFGLWLGFYSVDQATYLKIVRGYAARYRLRCAEETLEALALAWAATRGGRSGRVAWQFIQDLAGRLEQHLDDGS